MDFHSPLLWLAFMFLPAVYDSMLARVLVYHACAAVGYFTIAGVVLTSQRAGLNDAQDLCRSPCCARADRPSDRKP